MTLISEGLARVLSQYKNSPNLLATLEGLLTPLQELSSVLDVMNHLTDLETQEGVNLDVLGRLVGIERTIPNGGGVGIPLLAGDNDYRLLIKAKAFKNTSKGYPEDINTALALLWPTKESIFINTGGMEITILFLEVITPLMAAILYDLDLLPRAAGVGLNIAEVPATGTFFGFEDCPLSDTFGEDNDPLVGSPFAEYS